MSALDAVKTSAMSAVKKGVSTGHSSLAQVQGQTNKSLSTQQAGAQKGIASAVASSKAGIAQIGKGATKAVQAQHAVAGKALKGNAAQLKKLVGKAYIFKEDAAEVAADLKGGLKQISGKGIVAAGKTAKDAAGAASGASKGAKSGFGAQAHSASSSAASTAGGAAKGASGVAGSVSSQVKSTATSAATTGDHTVTSYTGKVKTAVGKVKDKFSSGLSTTKGEMDAHAAKVQGGTQKIPGENQGKVSQGQAKVNAEATKEPEKPSGLWGKIVSAAKWVAEKLKAAFKFVTQLLTDPGFWVSLIVAIALTAFVIATFGSGLAVLVVAGAVIGAISAGAGQITSNLAAGKSWNEGLGTAMLVGGAFGMIPGVGSALGKLGGAVARKVAPTIAGKFLSRAGSRVAQSFLGKGASALFQGAKGLTSRIGSAGRSLLNSGPGRVLTAPFRAVANLGTRAGNATSRGIANVRDRFVRTEAPGALKYSQKNIDSLVDQGRMTLDDLSQGMRDRGFRGSVDVVDNGPNGLLSIDNRRPYAANQAGVERVPVKVHAPDEVLTGSNVGRFKLERNIYVETGRDLRRGRGRQGPPRRVQGRHAGQHLGRGGALPHRQPARQLPALRHARSARDPQPGRDHEAQLGSARRREHARLRRRRRDDARPRLTA